MRCARFEQLLPLYAGGDLDAAAVERTEAHLRTCADCARAADEYKGVPHWVRLYTAPEFAEDFFDGIRRNVLREIETEAAAPGLAQTFSRFFSRTALAFASVAALVITSALILGLYLGGRRAPESLQAADSPRPSVAEGLATAGRTEATPPPASGGRTIATSSPAPGRASAQGGGFETKRTRPRVKAHAAVVAGGRPPGGATVAATETASGAGPERSPAATPTADGAAGRTEVAGAAPAAPQALRIEMQTRDPNVRIIWLVSQQTAAN